jgi:pimeloyl-ACP methyl ester carboxylesterase
MAGVRRLPQPNCSHPTQAVMGPVALVCLNVQQTAAMPAMSRPGPPRNGSTPTLLLVHGEFADGSVWAGVIAKLQAAGIEAIALANPLRGLTSDAAYIADATAAIDGPVILAGHGYGGAVITAAGPAPGNVVGLVYVAGFALDEAESALDSSPAIIGRFPGSQLLQALRPATLHGATDGSSVELYLDREAYPRVFAAGMPRVEAAAAAASQRPIAADALEEKSPAAAWKTVRSWYVIATADQVIPWRAQRFMAERADTHATEIHASHAVPQTHPVAVAEQIAAAAFADRRLR